MTQCPSPFHRATPWRSMTTLLQDCFKDLDLHIVLPLLISYHWRINTSLLLSLSLFVSTFLSVWSFYAFSLNSLIVPDFLTAPSSLHISLFLLSSAYLNPTLIWSYVCPSSFHLSSNFPKRVACSISSKHFWAKPNISWEQERNLNKRLSKHVLELIWII